MANRKIVVNEGTRFEKDGVVYSVVRRSGLNITLKNESTGEVLPKMGHQRITRYWKQIG